MVIARKEGLGYHELVDEELVDHAKTGDDRAAEFLITKYRNFVRVKAKAYFLIGADREDIIQEGMIGLYKAIRDAHHRLITTSRVSERKKTPLRTPTTTQAALNSKRGEGSHDPHTTSFPAKRIKA